MSDLFCIVMLTSQLFHFTYIRRSKESGTASPSDTELLRTEESGAASFVDTESLRLKESGAASLADTELLRLKESRLCTVRGLTVHGLLAVGVLQLEEALEHGVGGLVAAALSCVETVFIVYLNVLLYNYHSTC